MSIAALCEHFTEGEILISRALRELEAAGYLERRRERGPDRTDPYPDVLLRRTRRRSRTGPGRPARAAEARRPRKRPPSRRPRRHVGARAGARAGNGARARAARGGDADPARRRRPPRPSPYSPPCAGSTPAWSCPRRRPPAWRRPSPEWLAAGVVPRADHGAAHRTAPGPLPDPPGRHPRLPPRGDPPAPCPARALPPQYPSTSGGRLPFQTCDGCERAFRAPAGHGPAATADPGTISVRPAEPVDGCAVGPRVGGLMCNDAKPGISNRIKGRWGMSTGSRTGF